MLKGNEIENKSSKHVARYTLRTIFQSKSININIQQILFLFLIINSILFLIIKN